MYKRKHKFCTQSENAANLWVQYISCAIPYCAFLKKLSDSVYDETTSAEAKAAHSELLDTLLKEPQQEVEIDDPAPDASPTRKADEGKKPEEAKKPDSGKKIEEVRQPEEGKEEQKARAYSASVKEPGKNLMQELENDHEVFESPGLERVAFSSFNILEKIGAGAFGQIFKVQLASTGQIFAMKSISKSYLFKTKQLKYALTECKLLKQVDHPFVIKMHYAFQTPKFLYFILDFCAGGDLSMHLANRELFDENEARFYVAELILAIEYLHSRNIIYRDLKPDNILLGTSNPHVPSLRWPHQALRLRPCQRNVRPDGAGNVELLWEPSVPVAGDAAQEGERQGSRRVRHRDDIVRTDGGVAAILRRRHRDHVSEHRIWQAQDPTVPV